ncbi:MAG: YggT family protein [Magnetococcales bacterium]|nr:YggT family protein [Magnetococcales bacterium]
MILGSVGTLINFVLSIYYWLIIARVLLSWVNPDPYNPMVQFLRQATDPVLVPLRRMVPSVGGLDFSPIVALFGVMFLQKLFGALFSPMGVAGGSLAMLVSELFSVMHLLATLYMMLLVGRGGVHVHSWLSFRRGQASRINFQGGVIRFLFQVTEPVVRPLRRWVPTYSGLDVSPFVAALGMVFVISIIEKVIGAIIMGGGMG